MKFQISLFFLAVMAVEENFATGIGVSRAIKFVPEILLYDLQAISQYYQKFSRLEDRPTAYVRLPDKFTFKVRLDNDGYLKVYGLFKVLVENRKEIPLDYYNGLYYKNGAFFIETRIARSKQQISSNTLVRYKQPSLHIGVENKGFYLLIQYSSLIEVELNTDWFYKKHIRYFTNTYPSCPTSTFMSPFIVRYPSGHFFEFFLTTDASSTVSMAHHLRVLIGTTNKHKLNLTSNIEADRLVFNPETNKPIIIVNEGVNSQPLADVFGLRMANAGFLSEYDDGDKGPLKVFSSRHLSFEGPLSTHYSTSFHDLLEKVKTVEPRLSCVSSALKTGSTWWKARFQVDGQLLLKIFNLIDGVIDEDCPISVRYQHESFWIGGRWENKICTDESKLWLKTEEGPVFIETTQLVVFGRV